MKDPIFVRGEVAELDVGDSQSEAGLVIDMSVMTNRYGAQAKGSFDDFSTLLFTKILDLGRDYGRIDIACDDYPRRLDQKLGKSITRLWKSIHLHWQHCSSKRFQY